YVVDIPGIGIDQDRTWRFLPAVLNDLRLKGGWNPRLFIGWVRQFLPIARGEMSVPRWTGLHAASKQQSTKKKYDASNQPHGSAALLGCPYNSIQRSSRARFDLFSFSIIFLGLVAQTPQAQFAVRLVGRFEHGGSRRCAPALTGLAPTAESGLI